MSSNPYEPPKADSAIAKLPTQRDIANRRLRWSIVILMVAAFYNVAMFCNLSSSLPTTTWLTFSAVNFAGTAGAGVFVWLFAMPILERVVRLLHDKFSQKSTCTQWNGALHATLTTTIPVAIAGSLLWCNWVYEIYALRAEFYSISVTTGILAHLLAAAVYLQLPFRWWKIEANTTGSHNAG